MEAKTLSFWSGLSLLAGGIAMVVAGALIPGAQVLIAPGVTAIPTGIGILAAARSGPAPKEP